MPYAVTSEIAYEGEKFGVGSDFVWYEKQKHFVYQILGPRQRSVSDCLVPAIHIRKVTYAETSSM